MNDSDVVRPALTRATLLYHAAISLADYAFELGVSVDDLLTQIVPTARKKYDETKKLDEDLKKIKEAWADRGCEVKNTEEA